MKKFLSLNFGCRVNSAETNQFSQTLINQGFIPTKTNPDIIFINTCAITKKGEYESISTIKKLSKENPNAEIIVTGCANLQKINHLPNIKTYSNSQKEKLLSDLKSNYTSQIKDKFSHTHRFLLKIQSGCTATCTYCIVPLKRPNLWSLSINDAVSTTNSAFQNGYTEVILTGVNLNQYQPGFSNLVETLLTQTKIPLISFGSIPLLCIDSKIISLYQNPYYFPRLSHFLHIPLQSGSDKILKLMQRPYTKKDILAKFKYLKLKNKNLTFGTDLIVGHPGETDTDFQETLNLCQSIGFSKIHTFRFSPRLGTRGLILFKSSPKISQAVKKLRSQTIRNLVLK